MPTWRIGKDMITAKERLRVFIHLRKTVSLDTKLWLQRMVDVGTLRRVL